MQTEMAGEIITLTIDVAVFAMLRATYTLLALFFFFFNNCFISITLLKLQSGTLLCTKELNKIEKNKQTKKGRDNLQLTLTI